jgi:hypothetical protein
MSLATEILDRIPSRPTKQVSVVCVTAPAPGATPPTLGKFYINGNTTIAVPCRVQGGSTFTSGDSGMAEWTPPSLPICFKTN